jgi:predicted nucleic acid-binding protein
VSGFLLDTNCVSEMARVRPDPRVLEWMEAAGPQSGDFWARADALRASSRRQRSDSAALLREMRDAR